MNTLQNTTSPAFDVPGTRINEHGDRVYPVAITLVGAGGAIETLTVDEWADPLEDLGALQNPELSRALTTGAAALNRALHQAKALPGRWTDSAAVVMTQQMGELSGVADTWRRQGKKREAAAARAIYLEAIRGDETLRFKRISRDDLAGAVSLLAELSGAAARLAMSARSLL